MYLAICTRFFGIQNIVSDAHLGLPETPHARMLLWFARGLQHPQCPVTVPKLCHRINDVDFSVALLLCKHFRVRIGVNMCLEFELKSK